LCGVGKAADNIPAPPPGVQIRMSFVGISNAQARALSALVQGAGIILGPNGCRWTSSRYNKSVGKIKRSTAQALLRAGLIKAEAEYGKSIVRYGVSGAGVAAFAEIPVEAFAQESKLKVTAQDILRAVRKHYAPEGWVMAMEVQIPGLVQEVRRTDAFLVSPYRDEAIAIEVKVFRQDWQHELADPDKLRSSRRLAHMTYVAAPDGVVKPEELPSGVGLLMYLPLDRIISQSVRADYHEPELPTWNLVGRIAAGTLRAAKEL